MRHKVVLVGAGPGGRDLLTIKGKEYIENADCIVYDRLVSEDILALARLDCEMIYVGKENHHHVMKQDGINELLYQKALEYPLVVRLKGGDPYVFGRGGEEALYLLEKKADIDIAVIPGISSCIAALETAGIPITHRGVSKGFHVITAHTRKDALVDMDFGQLASEDETLVFLMGLAHVAQIAGELIKVGRSEDTPAAVISNGTRPGQRKCTGSLKNIGERTLAANLESPAIIVVGNVAAMAERLDFFEKRPLFGKTFIVPYIEGLEYSFSDGLKRVSESRLAVELESRGAQCICVKSGEIVPNEIDIRKDADWAVFTSRNGIYAFMWNLRRLGLDVRSLAGMKFAVVGSKTAQCLESFGIAADLVANPANSKALGEQLLHLDIEGRKIVIYTAAQTDGRLEQILGSKAVVEKADIYVNREVDVAAIDADADGIFYTSASSVKRIQPKIVKNPRYIFSIGPSCTAQLKQTRGTGSLVTAEETRGTGSLVSAEETRGTGSSVTAEEARETGLLAEAVNTSYEGLIELAEKVMKM